MAQEGRIGWIDWARALGACAIVLLHVAVSTYNAAEIGGLRTEVYILSGIALSRWAVPAFFMISGYLILDPSRSLDWRRAWSHAKRMLIVLATFGVFFVLIEEVAYHQSEGLPITGMIVVDSVVDVLTGYTWDHFWYVYALMFVYLLMPLLHLLRERWGTRALDLLALALFCLVLVVPTVLDVVGVFGVYEWPLFHAPWRSGIFYNTLIGLTDVCVGNWLRTKRLTPAALVCGVASLAAMLAISAWGMHKGWGSMNFVYMHESCLATVYGACVLLVLQRVVGDKPVPDGSLVAGLSRDSFGIYVIHPLFVHVLLLFVDPLAWPPVVYEAMLFAVVLAASVASTRLLRRVPLLRTVL